MYKEKAVKKLKEYSRIRYQQEYLRVQLAVMKDRFEHLPPDSKERPAKLATIKRIESVYSSNREIIEDVETCLSFLPERERTVLWHFYVERTDDYIEVLNEKLNVERSQIYRLKDKAIERFSMLSQDAFY